MPEARGDESRPDTEQIESRRDDRVEEDVLHEEGGLRASGVVWCGVVVLWRDGVVV